MTDDDEGLESKLALPKLELPKLERPKLRGRKKSAEEGSDAEPATSDVAASEATPPTGPDAVVDSEPGSAEEEAVNVSSTAAPMPPRAKRQIRGLPRRPSSQPKPPQPSKAPVTTPAADPTPPDVPPDELPQAQDTMVGATGAGGRWRAPIDRLSAVKRPAVKLPALKRPAVKRPNLQRPTLDRFRSQSPKQPKQPRSGGGVKDKLAKLPLPNLSPRVTAALIGLAIGLALVLSTAGVLRGCEAVRGTKTCGGSGGFALLLALIVLAIYVGGLALRLFSIPDPLSTSFLAIGIVVVLSMLLFIESLLAWWMILVIPALSAAAYALSHYVTTAFVEPAMDQSRDQRELRDTRVD